MNMIATLKSASLAIALLGVSFSAAAEDPAPDWTYAGNAALTSDYIFRGLTQTEKKPALQAGWEADHASGFYVGAWGSSISWLRGAGSDGLEFDYYAGYRTKFGEDWGLDVGLYGYYYPGSYTQGFTRPYTDEAYVALSYKFLSLKYSDGLTNLFGFYDSKNSGYVDLSANWEFVPSWTLNAHVGHQQIKHYDDYNYTDYKLGVTKAFAGNWSAALAWYDTDADDAYYTYATNSGSTYNQGRSTVVLTLTKTF